MKGTFSFWVVLSLFSNGCFCFLEGLLFFWVRAGFPLYGLRAFVWSLGLVPLAFGPFVLGFFFLVWPVACYRVSPPPCFGRRLLPCTDHLF